MMLPKLTIALALAPTPSQPPESPPPDGVAEAPETPPTKRRQRSPPPYRRHFVGTSAFMIMNAIPDDEPPSFFQLNYGFRITPKNVISVEAITWKYYGPLGRQYWHSGDNYPGSVRSAGLAVAYQRFLWRGLYVGVHALHLLQTFMEPDGSKIQHGFQLFMTARVGYHVQLFNNRVFLEPSMGMTSWPINTNLPAAFQAEEDKWGKFFFFEPGLHLGVKF